MLNRSDSPPDGKAAEHLRADGVPPAAPARRALSQLVIDQSPAGMLATDAMAQITFVNKRLCDMLGYTEAELLGSPVLGLFHPDDVPATLQAMQSLVNGQDQITLSQTLLRRNGTLLHASTPLAALRDPARTYLGISAVVIAATGPAQEGPQPDQKLRDSEWRLRQIIDNTLAMVGVLTPDGTLIEANKPALAGADLRREDVVGKKFWDCHWWCHDPEAVARLQLAVTQAASGEAQRYDAVVRMAQDELITLDFMLAPVFGEDGQVMLLVPSGFDISCRKRGEEKLAYLMREVNHRSKNLLSVVQSMLRQMRPVEVTRFVADFGARLRALSSCQDMLVNASDRNPALKELILSQLGHFRDVQGTRLRLKGPDLLIAPDVAQNLGMAIYELTTNAAKYGALSNDTGQIDLEWAIAPGRDGQAPLFRLSWQERDGPPVTPPKQKGFGSVVLEDMLAMALNADVQMDFAPGGLRWSVNCPLQQILPA